MAIKKHVTSHLEYFVFKLYLLLPLFETEYWNMDLSTFSNVLTFLFIGLLLTALSLEFYLLL